MSFSMLLLFFLFWRSYGANPTITWLVIYVQKFLFKNVIFSIFIVYEIQQLNPFNFFQC